MWQRWSLTNIPLDQALDCVFGYAVGFDLTKRDLQCQRDSVA
jgi:2-keto-4-pentenoate hydratase/2-oxohepta-3-ene-1,7-dioic acid hydratase in catechol pathway